MTTIDYTAHPHFNPDAETTQRYNRAIMRLGAAFAKELTDQSRASLLAEAKADLAAVTPDHIRERYGLGSGYSLSKEFDCEVYACNSAATARILEQQGRATEAAEFLAGQYRQAQDAGFGRASEFLQNRIDSRSFMPMRRHIDAAYLHRIGYDHLDQVLLCVGDCQTIIQAEKLRDSLPLPGINIAGYQHALGSLQQSPLATLFSPVGYLFFVNSFADFLILHRGTDEGRQKEFDRMHAIVNWLKTRPTIRKSVFVTHVFCGVDNAVKAHGVPLDTALAATTAYCDQIAEILAGAPHVELINFQEICPFTRDKSVFRDKPDDANLLHFRFDIMDRVSERITACFKHL